MGLKSYGAQGAQALGMVPMVVEQSSRGERAYDIFGDPSGCGKLLARVACFSARG